MSARMILKAVSNFYTDYPGGKPVYCLDFLYENDFSIRNFLMKSKEEINARYSRTYLPALRSGAGNECKRFIQTRVKRFLNRKRFIQTRVKRFLNHKALASVHGCKR